jgi:hypothetical protein
MGCVNADASGFVIRAAAGDDTPSGINAGVAKGLFRGVEVDILECELQLIRLKRLRIYSIVALNGQNILSMVPTAGIVDESQQRPSRKSNVIWQLYLHQSRCIAFILA